MEKLNDYLQTLLSTCSYELHLEPNKNPYLVSANGANDVNNTPLLGTQISMMVFPLIPNSVKQQLPSQPEVEFVHPHNLGKFNFLVKKSPAGFNVTIRPMLSDKPTMPDPMVESILQTDSALSSMMPPPNSAIREAMDFTEPEPFTFESSSSALENNANIAVNSYASPEIQFDEFEEFQSGSGSYDQPEIEIISVNDPEFQTTFSDTSTYEPPAKRQEFEVGQYVSPTSDFILPDDGYEFKPEAPAVSEKYPQSQNFVPQQQAQPVAPVQSTSTNSVPVNPVAEVEVPSPVAAAQTSSSVKARMDALFYKMADAGASDLHMSVSMPPAIRKDGKMQGLPCDETTLTPESMRELLTSIMPKKNQEEFAERKDTDFAYEIPGLARFRANIFADRKGMGAQ